MTTKPNQWQNEQKKTFSFVKDFFGTDYFEKYSPYRMDKLRVLDIGAGDGRLYREKGHLIKDYFAFDIDISGLLKLQSEHKNVIITNLKDLDSHSIDVITLIDVIEHLTFNEIKEIKKVIDYVLVPEGRVIISTPNYSKCLQVLSNFIDNPEHTRGQNTESIKKIFPDYKLILDEKFSPYINPIKIIQNILVYSEIPYLNRIFVLEK